MLAYINLVIAILDNVDHVIGASAKAEYKRLVNNWNDYCDATPAYLEEIDDEGDKG
jgi:hypothetical protein